MDHTSSPLLTKELTGTFKPEPGGFLTGLNTNGWDPFYLPKFNPLKKRFAPTLFNPGLFTKNFVTNRGLTLNRNRGWLWGGPILLGVGNPKPHFGGRNFFNLPNETGLFQHLWGNPRPLTLSLWGNVTPFWGPQQTGFGTEPNRGDPNLTGHEPLPPPERGVNLPFTLGGEPFGTGYFS